VTWWMWLPASAIFSLGLWLLLDAYFHLPILYKRLLTGARRLTKQRPHKPSKTMTERLRPFVEPSVADEAHEWLERQER
jgi:hypothetical protein